jgi:hypothetical protein
MKVSEVIEWLETNAWSPDTEVWVRFDGRTVVPLTTDALSIDKDGDVEVRA